MVNHRLLLGFSVGIYSTINISCNFIGFSLEIIVLEKTPLLGNAQPLRKAQFDVFRSPSPFATVCRDHFRFLLLSRKKFKTPPTLQRITKLGKKITLFTADTQLL